MLIKIKFKYNIKTIAEKLEINRNSKEIRKKTARYCQKQNQDEWWREEGESGNINFNEGTSLNVRPLQGNGLPNEEL